MNSVSDYGYKTNAVCVMKVVRDDGPATITSRLVDISMDKAEVFCETSLPIGSKLSFKVKGYQMPELPARVVSNDADTGLGYRLGLKLSGSFTYDVFVSLSRISSETKDVPALATSTPDCLKELGLELPCSVTDAEEAFDQRVQKAHPDRGGDVNSFVRLRSAYLEALEYLKRKA